jgi:alcohol dehydrogenase YqhD (iron-dependent ADH family)
MRDFVFYNPTKVYFGKGVNASAGEAIAGAGISRVLVHYGGASAKTTGVLDDVAERLAAAGVTFAECGGARPNPVVSKAREAIAVIRRENLQAVVAIGGGSVIDSAKAVACGAKYDGDVWDFYERKAKIADALPLYAVATVSATASEMNSTSVMTNDETQVKVGLTDEALFPRATFLDPSVQFTVPARQVADGGIDAVCHVMETYFDGTPDVEVQMEYAEGLVRSLIALVPKAIASPRDYETRAQYAWASANALNGTTWAGHDGRGDFASHAMGHAVSAVYDAVHGETLAAVMPSWMRYVMNEDLPAFARFAKRVLGVERASDEERALEGIARVSAFFSSLGAPSRLRDLGVPEAALPALAEKAAGAKPIGVLKKLSAADVLNIYRAAY